MRKVWLLAKRFIASPYLSLVLRLYIGYVFIHASASKIHYPAEFAESLAAYQILPYWSVNFMALVMPWLELTCGLFLILGLRTKVVTSIIASLLVVFTIAILLNVIKGAPISCGCFENVDHPIGWQDIARDIGWLVLTLQIFFFDKINLLRREGLVFLKKQER
jgi:putative oxidoreductase